MADAMMSCACCGKAEVDDIKLKICTACKLVKYCSVNCQKNHRSQHKKACKKRAAEIRDARLFTQPDESHLGECPLCCLPIPLDKRKSTINTCCSKLFCNGCVYANKLREWELNLEPACPFCRETLPKSEEESKKINMKRVKVNDPVALCQEGKQCFRDGKYAKQFEYQTKAVELGNIESHYQLSFCYDDGLAVEKDPKKKVYHLEEAAIGGHAEARYNLGCIEAENGRHERAMRHYIIAAKLGHSKANCGTEDGDGALDLLQQWHSVGFVSKENFEAALRGYQSTIEAAKSQQRDAAEEYYKQCGL